MKKSIILALFTYAFIVCHAQIPEMPKAMLSPNAASLGLYGEIPVSHFTGTPSIEIPLYEVNDGVINFPISLSYHASGVRPDQHPGWTGMGWTLNAGGVISRQIKGLLDECSHFPYNDGFYYKYEILNKSNWGTEAYLKQMAGGAMELGAADTEPDEFYFNFRGYSGRFYLNHEGKWVAQCDKPVKVVFNNSFINAPFNSDGTELSGQGYTKTFSAFTIITEDGTQYIFGGSENYIEYSIDFFHQDEDNWVANSWFLSKIIYTNNQEVNFHYTRGDFVNQMYYSLNYTDGYSKYCAFFSITSLEKHCEGKLISPVYLEEIIFPNTRVILSCRETTELRYGENIYKDKYDMSWEDQLNGKRMWFLSNGQTLGFPTYLNRLKWYKLTDISIEERYEGTIQRQFDFQYSNNRNERLRLLSVTESGEFPHTETGVNLGSAERKYIFEYDNPELLPAYLANQNDHWGFYNARPGAILPMNSYYSRREPNANVLLYGTLNKITYPTGGYTRFEFEPHSYRKELQEERWKPCVPLPANRLAGGLRIKRIINSATGTESGEVVAKEYHYTSDYLTNGNLSEISSGILGGKIRYNFAYKIRAYGYSTVIIMSVFSTQSVLPGCENSTGNHIGYTEVVEKIPGNGFTRYTFTNFDNGYGDEPPLQSLQESQTPYEPYTSKAFMRGHLLRKEDYDEGKNIVKRQELIYGSPPATAFIRCIKARNIQFCYPTFVAYLEGTTYKIYTGVPRVVMDSTALYSGSSVSISDIASYSYDTDGLLNQVMRTPSGGIGSQRIRYLHPRDMEQEPYITMVAKNILSPVIEEKEDFITNDTAVTFVSSRSNHYKAVQSVSPNFFTLASIYTSDGKWRGVEETRFRQHDKYGNPVYFTHLEEDIVMIFGYGGRYPVAEIRNATWSEVNQKAGSIGLNLSTFPDGNNPDMAKVDTLRNLLPNALVTTCTYLPGVGVATITDPRGMVFYHTYDGLGNIRKVYYKESGEERIIHVYDYNYKN